MQRVFVLVVSLFLLLSLTFVGCSGGDKPTCKEDTDCGAGKACEGGTCKEKKVASKCTAASDCPSGQTCENGACKAKASTGCNSNADCTDAAKKVCDSVSRACVGCLINSDCSSTQTCSNGVCKDNATTECKSDSDCKGQAKKYCSDSNKCELDCKSNSHCPAGQTCKNGSCESGTVQGCSSNSDCKTASLGKCDTAAKKCVECLTNGDCKGGGKPACNNNTCQAKAAGCRPACKATEFCFGDKRCLPKVKSCKVAADCESNQLCIDPGTGRVCLLKCDPTANTSKTDPTNASCWSGYGHCLSASRTNPKSGVCVPPPGKTRKQGETCRTLSEPEKPSYNDCASGGSCIRSGTTSTCWKSCDPKKNVGGDPKKSDINPDCKTSGGDGYCRILRNGTSACDPRIAKRNKGETCRKTDPTDPGFHDCKKDLLCSGGLCLEKCDTAKEGSCGANRHCIRSGTAGYCVDACDPAKGVVKGSNCKSGFYCGASSTYKPGYCRSLPSKKVGTKQFGEACSRFTSSKFCDGAKGLVCKSSKCVRSCDPKTGQGCQSGEECIEDTFNSHQGGVCLKKASQGLGDICDSSNKRCNAGLQCYRSRCAKQCDPSKTAPGDCTATQHCYRSFPKGVCLGKCDPAKGVVKGSSCKDGYYCNKSATYKPGFCRTLPDNKKKGSKQLGEGCSNFTATKFCDGGKGLYCKFPKCTKACNPRTGGKECSSTEECVEDTSYSYLGGACLGKAVQKEGDACDGVSKRCATGLICSSKKCARKCDRTKPNASGCKSGERCVSVTGGGACVAASQKINDACSTTKLCVSGLECVTFDRTKNLSFCKKACDPSATTSGCASGTSCRSLSTSNPKSGACVDLRKNSRKKGETCLSGDPSKPEYHDCVKDLGCSTSTNKCEDGAKLYAACGASTGTKPCASQFTCAGSRRTNKYFCLKKCDPKASSSCGAGFKCVPISSGGVCAQICSANTDCTVAGKTCTALSTALGKLCL